MTELIECYDVGGTNIRGALIDKNNHKNIVVLKTCNTARGNPQKIIEQIAGLSSLLRKAMSQTDKVIAVSVGLPGPVDNGILLGSAPMQIRSTFDVTSELRKHFSEPVYVENDLKAAVRTELGLGIGRQVKNFYLLTISTGIGVGIVLGGRAISSGMSGEFGHCILERDARKANKCGCGRYGCWGAMSSGYGIELTARRELGRKLSVKEFFDIYEKGDQKAKKIVEKIRDYNAHGIGNMLNAFCVDVIVVMGSVGLKQFERIIPSKKEIKKYSVNKIPKIIKAKLGDTIGLLGAYLVAREKNWDDDMQVGFVGLGKMGSRMVKRLLSKKFDVICYDIDIDARLKIAKQGAKTVSSLKELTKELAQPRKIILMIPAGEAVDKVIAELHLSKGDMIVDAGNSHYEDSVRRAKMLKEKEIYFIDAGTSGGLEGAEGGSSFTVGGEREVYEKVKPIFEALAAKDGLCYVGPSGSGHFVKMVHNAIEYAMLQAYAEGFELLSKAPYKLNLAEIAHAWNNGGLIRSWLLRLAEEVLKSDEPDKMKGTVGGGETGTWAVDEATKRGVAFPIIKTALAERVKSKHTETFTGRFIAAMRNKFGGHRVYARAQKVYE